MRSGTLLILLLTLTCWTVPAAPGAARASEAATPGKKEVTARVVPLQRLGFLTPNEARQKFPRVKLAGGKANLPLGGLGVKLERGVLSLTGDVVNKQFGVAVPDKGFSRALASDLPAKDKDGAKRTVALCFAATGEKDEFFVRNMNVATAQYGAHTITVVDDNCNGRYNDLEADAIIADRGLLAVPLGSTLMLGNMPHGIEVAEDGSSITVTQIKEFKLGGAMVSRQEYRRQLIGAVLKGPAGGYHAISDQGPSVLPVGKYNFVFASLGTPAANQLACLEGGGRTSLDIKSGRTAAILEFGRPSFKVEVTCTNKGDTVRVRGPRTTGITCKAGTFHFFFRLGTPRLDISSVGARSGSGQLARIPMPLGTNGEPGSVSFNRTEHRLLRNRTYRFEITWPVSVMDDVKGSATLKLQ
jgi:hypothetical protein